MNSAQVKEKYNQSLFSTDLIGVYLKEIGKIPLLDDEEEVIYGKQIQQMMSLLREKEKLEKQRGEVISHREWSEVVGLSETELNQVLQQGSLAKTQMIKANLRLVVAVAKKYQKRNLNLEFLDLIQEGNLGLERGVEKFDPSQGYRLSTYIYWWIRQGITRAIAQKSRTIHLPVNINEKLNKIKNTQLELSQKLRRSPTTNEIAQELGIESSKIREYLKAAKEPISLDMRVGNEEDTELSQMLSDDSASPSDEITQRLMKRDVNKMLLQLKPKQRQVIALRFGLEDGEEWSLRAIGKKLNLSGEGVRRLEKKALTHLRKKNFLALKDYLVS